VRFSRAQLVREALWSCSSIVVFALVIVLTVYLDRRFGVMQLYTGIDGPGWIWFWLSIPVAILMHDLYFYASHRFMHLPGVYERVHRVHHLSTNPSPLAAFAFHPVEALIEIAGVVLIAIILPMHTAAFAVFTLIVLVTNVLGHLGHELFPPGFERSALGRVVNTATSHNQHHRTFAYNFGLYTLVWDRLFGTVHPGYGRLFARVAGEKTSESSPSEA
jgi:sterol desaturase/sphingolipid hydroxylase (fatty acid hydroxylase superfamily)